MSHCSNDCICMVNFMALVAAVPITFLGFQLKKEPASQCLHSVTWSLIIIGIALIILALLGIVGSCCRVNCFLFFYLFFMFLVIIAVIVSVIFVFSVTNKKFGEKVSENKLGSSTTNWVDRWTTKNWGLTQSCFRDTKLCNSKLMIDLGKKESLISTIFKGNVIYNHLSPIQTGCCQPPSDCGYKYVDNAYWETPNTTSSNADCKAWKNGVDGMCYDCQSCKAGVVESLVKQMKFGAYVDIAVLVYLIIILCIGCCAFHNNRRRKYERY